MSNHLKLIRAFPKALLDDVLVISKYLESKKIKTHESSQCEVLIHHEHIVVPSRIYITQLQCIEFHNFSLTQRQILWCILTRHHNGFVRQRALERLIKTDLTSFMIPFIFQLLGEYVQEILEAIEPILDANNQGLFAAFMLQNPKYDQTTQSRIVSYWNEYYRIKYPNFNDFIGYKILNKLKSFVLTYRHH